ncbi:hypothetical protein KIL84_008872, partial [Mauremys mutica]
MRTGEDGGLEQPAEIQREDRAAQPEAGGGDGGFRGGDEGPEPDPGPQVTITENTVFAIGTESWPVLWRVTAECESDWEQCYGPAFPGMTTTQASSRQPAVSPLSLNADSRRPQSQQMSPTLSPLSPITQAVAMDALSLEQQLPPYQFFTQTSSQQQQQTQVASSLPQNTPLMQTSGLQRGSQLPPLSVTVPSTIPQSPPGSQTQPSMGIDINSHSSILGSVFGDSYYDQQMTARQANALSHQ